MGQLADGGDKLENRRCQKITGYKKFHRTKCQGKDEGWCSKMEKRICLCSLGLLAARIELIMTLVSTLSSQISRNQ